MDPLDFASYDPKVRKRLLSRMSYRQREVLKLTSGVGDGHRYSLVELSHIFKTTVEEIQDTLQRALEIAEHEIMTQDFKDFLDSIGGASNMKAVIDKSDAKNFVINEISISDLKGLVGGPETSIYVVPGEATREELAEYFHELSELHRLITGVGLEFHVNGSWSLADCEVTS